MTLDQDANADSTNSQSAEQLLSCSIILHIPVLKEMICSDVCVEFKSPNGYSANTTLCHLFEEIWRSGFVLVPADTPCLEYRCKFKVLKLGFWRTSTEILQDYSWKEVKITPVIRDFFIIKGIDSFEKGLVQHFRHQLAVVNADNLKIIIMEIDDLISLSKHYMEHARMLDNRRLLCTLEQYITEKQSHINRETFILFGYICAQLCSGSRRKKMDDVKTISKQTSTAILKGLQTLPQNALPVGSLKCFENIVSDLCLIVFPNKSSLIVHLLEFCYPVLSSTFVMSNFDNLGQLEFSCDLKMCEWICNKILEQEKAGDKDASILLQKFLQHAPISSTIDIVQSMVLHTPTNQQVLLDLLRSRIVAQSKKSAKEKNFDALLKLVNDLTSSHEDIVSVVSEILTKTVISMVKGLRKSDSADFPQVLKLMDSQILFTSQESCEEIYGVMVASENKYIHTLYLKLLDSEQMRSAVDQKMYKWVMKWFETAINHHCYENRHNDKCDDLPHVYKHLNLLLSKPSVLKRDKLVTDLKEEAYKFLNYIPLKLLMQNLCFKSWFDSNDLPESFGPHLIRRLSVSSDGKNTALTTIGTSSEFQDTCNDEESKGVLPYQFKPEYDGDDPEIDMRL
ncbi:uncharacterized protein LOC121391060 isoform X2 [Gigantopelta aegis]|uniref:uncharacterized protein LOC121391060 isoform X2 n=1 Tax=Gigantopelta aegis TaxID=1735272 RepID=UPI001B88A4B1|nr:uncharacterized protein LOC121391060 isoform X2 [Gigantopelta aegis]